MLKRNDLAKQFELVVKQEIVNYNNSLNAILQSIRDLKQEIDDIKEMAIENHASLQALQNEYRISYENFKNDTIVSLNKFGSFSNDQRNINTKVNDKLKELDGLIIGIKGIHLAHEKDINNLNKDIDNTKELTKKLYHSSIQYIDHQNSLINESIQQTKEFILSKPSDASLVKKELNEKISSHAVDVQGLLKELRFNDHKVMVLEKKIEQIYMLIDRLKKSEVKP